MPRTSLRRVGSRRHIIHFAAVLSTLALTACGSPTNTASAPSGPDALLGVWVLSAVPERLLTAAGQPPPLNADAAAVYAARLERLAAGDSSFDQTTWCASPGMPRVLTMPYPFEITQSTDKIHLAYAFATTARTIYLDEVDPPPADTWMGHSVGRWEGNTLVVDVTNFNDKTWFDRAGNFHSEALHLVERFTLATPDVIQYEVTIDDPKVFTRPWRIAMPIYRRMEPNIQLLEYRCTEFAEEFLYGHIRKEPLVKHWEGETMTVDITRKIPPGDKFYEWFRK